jgi:demethylmenaquinone methyltransferase/2-methoxy-6-polyprenyl-1,4-benzoquinol methylase
MASAARNISEQVEYYRARASEYDQWWYRQGRYDRGAAINARWLAECATLQAWVASTGPFGDVAELAAGTGLWTRLLAPMAASVLAVDASTEMLQRNRDRTRSQRVTYDVADLFTWQPPRRFDVVFLAFWLSHVPAERFDQFLAAPQAPPPGVRGSATKERGGPAKFWRLVDRTLRPGGRVLLLDSLFTPSSTATDHVLDDPDAATVTRRLDDGREFQIVKVFYEPAQLVERLRAIGWTATIDTTGEFFLYGTATRT